MSDTVTMALIKPAKAKGGDRYECDYQGDRMVVYVPQSISRKAGNPVNLLTLTFAPFVKD
jgi:hypothetical protein